jgi:hypothetical protein
MLTSLQRLRRHALALAAMPALVFTSACKNDVSIEGDVLEGNYVATSFLVTQSGQAPVDVISKGGSLTINIAGDSSTTGLLLLPAGVLSPQGGTASMAGRVTRRLDGSFRFTQPTEDTFIEQLDWQQFTGALVSTTFISNTQFQITLRK